VKSGVSYTLGDFLENLTLTGSANIDATGNDANNVLTGNSGDNVLDGGIGKDTMAGGAGNDTYVVDSATDVVTESSSAGGVDTVRSSLAYTLGTNVENLVLTGGNAVNATGNTLNNNLTGNSGNNVLDGKTGADAMAGGDGDDNYVVDNLGDTVTESANVNGGNDSVTSGRQLRARRAYREPGLVWHWRDQRHWQRRQQQHFR
jgi:Ca2+-binding RTX toxin-like protein